MSGSERKLDRLSQVTQLRCVPWPTAKQGRHIDIPGPRFRYFRFLRFPRFIRFPRKIRKNPVDLVSEAYLSWPLEGVCGEGTGNRGQKQGEKRGYRLFCETKPRSLLLSTKVFHRSQKPPHLSGKRPNERRAAPFPPA